MEKIKKFDQFVNESDLPTYDDFDKDKKTLTQEELRNKYLSKFKIVVPTYKDKADIMKALLYIHGSVVDTNKIDASVYPTVNQLALEYSNDGKNIIVNRELYNKLKT